MQTLIFRAASVARAARLPDPGILAAAALALPILILFAHAGLPLAADSEIHLQRIASVIANFEAGHLWARWTPYLHQGYGYPIHNFYAPGLHLLGAALSLLLNRLDLVVVYKLLLFVTVLLYPIGAYLWARRDFGAAGALAAAAAYLYTPFRFHELLAQQNLSQLAAMALLPFMLWAIRRAADSPRPRAVALLGALYAAATLLHHPTALLFSPFAAGYALFLLRDRLKDRLRFPRRLIRPALVIGGGLILGAALAAAFWLPALLELRYTQISSFQTGIFSIRANFIAFDDLIAGIGLTDTARFGLPPMLQAGRLHLIAVVGALAALILLRPRGSVWTSRAKGTLIFGAVVVGVCLFLITPASEAIWTHLPLANLIVYPWRLLGVIAVMALPGIAALPLFVPARWRNTAAVGVAACFILSAMPLLVIPPTFTDASAQSAEDELRYEQRTGNVGLTSGDEYLPIWAKERPLAPPDGDYSDLAWRVYVQSSEPAASVSASTPCDAGVGCYTINTAGVTRVTLAQLYFPGWTVSVDGAPADLEPVTANGLIGFSVPSGSHQVEIRYSGTTAQHVGEAITLLGLAALVLLIGWRIPPTTPPPALTAAERLKPSIALPVGAALALVALLNAAWITPQTGWFRIHSDPANPPAQHLVHAVFGDAAGGLVELLGYDLADDQAAPGDSVRLTLYWRLIRQTSHGLRGGVALTAPAGRDVWANSSSLNLGGGIPTNLWTLDQYVVDAYTLEVAPDAPPYVGDLRVSVFTQDEEGGIHNLTLPDGDSAAVIGSLRLIGTEAAPADLTPLDAAFADSLKLAGYAFAREGDQQCITLRWNAIRGDLPELAVMLHLQDQDGAMLAAADGAPLDDLYPTTLWQADQNLNDRHCFAVPDAAVDLAVGLYRRDDNQRLPLTHAEGSAQADDAILLRLPNS